MFKVPEISNINFFIENDPPPFGTFPKIHPIWQRDPSLKGEVIVVVVIMIGGVIDVLLMSGNLLVAGSL